MKGITKKEFIKEWRPFSRPATSTHTNRQREINENFIKDLDLLLQAERERCVRDIDQITVGECDFKIEDLDKFIKFKEICIKAIRDNDITHWQLLPNPPITKKRGGCNP